MTTPMIPSGKPFVANAEMFSEQSISDPEAGEWLSLIEISLVRGLGDRHNELISTGDPCWGALYSLLKRIHEHASGAVCLFYNNHWEPLEVVTRAVIEASATSILLAKRDREIRLSQILTHHFSTMRKRVLASDESEVDAAKNIFDQRVSFANRIFADTCIRFDTIGWPKTTKDRFAAADMAHEYAHIYANLSSNVHGDAEYLLDDMICRVSADHEPASAELAQCDKCYWARYFVYNSLLYYAFAARCYAAAYCSTAALVDLDNAIVAIERKLALHAEDYVKSVYRIKNIIKTRTTRGRGFG